jgi:hypothetical protein
MSVTSSVEPRADADVRVQLHGEFGWAESFTFQRKAQGGTRLGAGARFYEPQQCPSVPSGTKTAMATVII